MTVVYFHIVITYSYYNCSFIDLFYMCNSCVFFFHICNIMLWIPLTISFKCSIYKSNMEEECFLISEHKNCVFLT